MYIEDNSASGRLSVYRAPEGYKVILPDGDTYATIGRFMEPEAALAAARLLAAAPETAAERDRLLAINQELLAALTAFVEWEGRLPFWDGPRFERARCAIAKAREK